MERHWPHEHPKWYYALLTVVNIAAAAAILTIIAFSVLAGCCDPNPSKSTELEPEAK